MAVYDSPGPRAGGAVAVLSPRQFHDRVEGSLRAAISAGASERREEALRRLSGFLREVPSLGPGQSQPPDLPRMLTDGIRRMLECRSAAASADPERLLADLLEFVLAYYPEAEPPPLWNGSGQG